uniref:Pre-mRNA-splicing factor SLU7 n=1 Tax=Panagrellus redivivus TaxID=6233 RepID=A0A7E4VDN2_PANRE
MSSDLGGDVALEDTENTYAKDQETRHKRKIILPCVIPWEYGSNKYASQAGQGGFGRIRNNTLKIESTKNLSEGNDGVVPWHACPPLHDKYATLSGEKPFGAFRDHVTKVTEHSSEAPKPVNDILVDKKATERILTKWTKPNPEAKNDELYGRRRNAVTEAVGGRAFTHDELRAQRAAVPRFQNFAESAAAKEARPGEAPVMGYQARRQATTVIAGLDRTPQDQLDSNRYMAWLGGQLTMQSQSKTGGFNKPRDVVNTSFYHKLMNEKDASPAELFALRKKEREQAAKAKEAVDEEDEVEEVRDAAQSLQSYEYEVPPYEEYSEDEGDEEEEAEDA